MLYSILHIIALGVIFVTRIKICGITRIEDAMAAVEAGADALGFVFYKDSPRAITIDQAKNICQQLPPFITSVGLFVNASNNEVLDIANYLHLDLLQFHGEESAEYCEQFNYPWIKAIRVQPDTNIEAAIKNYKTSKGILLDSYVHGVQGGTGTTFDWSLIPQNLSKPIILAGGLTIDNVQQAIQSCRPYAVDVSGGVELSKGLKDHDKIKRFIHNVKNSL